MNSPQQSLFFPSFQLPAASKLSRRNHDRDHTSTLPQMTPYAQPYVSEGCSPSSTQGYDSPVVKQEYPWSSTSTYGSDMMRSETTSTIYSGSESSGYGLVVSPVAYSSNNLSHMHPYNDSDLCFTHSEAVALWKEDYEVTGDDLAAHWQQEVANGSWDIDRNGVIELSSPRSTSKKPAQQSAPAAPCRIPNCGKKFTRPADLARHEAKVHNINNHEWFYCDYSKCDRSRDPFGRKDHYRDHLRMYHKEDVGKRSTKEEPRASKDSRVTIDWFRCSRCLARVEIASSGWACTCCGTEIEEKRKIARTY